MARAHASTQEAPCAADLHSSCLGVDVGARVRVFVQLPFLVFNHPDAEVVVRKWAQPGYLEKLTKAEKFKTEVWYSVGVERGRGKGGGQF